MILLVRFINFIRLCSMWNAWICRMEYKRNHTSNPVQYKNINNLIAQGKKAIWNEPTDTSIDDDRDNNGGIARGDEARERKEFLK
jgi:hypothetical protein